MYQRLCEAADSETDGHDIEVFLLRGFRGRRSDSTVFGMSAAEKLHFIWHPVVIGVVTASICITTTPGPHRQTLT